jgi:hypothetical protein
LDLVHLLHTAIYLGAADSLEFVQGSTDFQTMACSGIVVTQYVDQLHPHELWALFIL